MDSLLLGFIGIAVLLWLGILLTHAAWPSTDVDEKHFKENK